MYIRLQISEAVLALQYHKAVLNDDDAHQIMLWCDHWEHVLRDLSAKIALKIWALVILF